MITPLPLDGTLMLDFSQFLAGPMAAMRLGDHGARRIKIERAQGGDIGRRRRLTRRATRPTSRMGRTHGEREHPIFKDRVPKGSQVIVDSIIRTVFAGPDREYIERQFTEVTTILFRSHPKVAAMIDDARPGLRAFAGFPQQHWRQIWPTNPLERVNKEIKRRTVVVGVFPNPAALLRLADAVLADQYDEWEAGDLRYFSRIIDARIENHERPDPACRAGAYSPRTHRRQCFKHCPLPVMRKHTTRRVISSPGHRESAAVAQ